MKTFKLDHITKIEGHADLHIKVDGDKIEKVEVSVVEGARFFEAMLKNRRFDEAPLITSRICGICHTTHSLSSIRAVESAIDFQPSEQTKTLRELAFLAEQLQSHVLHIYFLALPDYVGFPSAIAAASKYPNEVKRALRLKRLANDLVEALIGREIHTVSMRVGGFTRLPTQTTLDSLLNKLKESKPEFDETAKLFGSLSYPNFQRKTTYMALKNNKDYSFIGADLGTSEGASFAPAAYTKHLEEYIASYSNTKPVKINGHGYAVGALARINLNQKFLSDDAKRAIEATNIKFPNDSPFINNFAQAVECVHIIDRCISLLENLKLKNERKKKIELKAGRGVSATEAPRGTVFHDYFINKQGVIGKTNIITPTAQNLKNIEEDVAAYMPELLKLGSEDKILFELEKLIRAYDPCISCSAHFLTLKIERK
ncbi:MAG: Ni/Fe hydrogenase subunit alpha [Candidatus Micrarchaeota archaeon]